MLASTWRVVGVMVTAVLVTALVTGGLLVLAALIMLIQGNSIW